MADNKINVSVELKTVMDSANKQVENLKTAGAINEKTSKEIDAITAEIEELGKVANPTLRQLNRINTLFNQLSDIIIKASQSVKNMSQEYRDLQKNRDDIEKKKIKAQEDRAEIFKAGRVNKESGNYELYTTFQNDFIKKAQITRKNGSKVASASSFYKQFENGVVKEGVFQNPEEAQKIYNELQALQRLNGNKLKELNEAISQYTEELKTADQKLEEQGSKESNPIPAEAAANKTKLSTAIGDAKDNINKNLKKTDPTAPVTGGLSDTTADFKSNSGLSGAFKQFTLYTIVMNALRAAGQEAVKTIKELDKYLTEQAMVTGMTREETYKLVGTYQELALQCGATTKEIAQVSTEYMKQGKTVQESLVLTEAAVKAAKVARVSVGDSVNYLTTALNGFQLATEDAMKVSDKFAAVAASSATDYDELAIALSKVASQANLAGMSIDYTTALLTKGLETTREAPETMGTALKTIIARMRELGDYGETLEGDTDVNNVESQLAYVGIALRDTNGELRSTEEVLDELGKKWDTLDKNQQAALAKALAGTRQQSRLIAVMDGYERVTELQEISMRSAGATAAQAGVYLEGMEAALNNIQVAWEKIVMTLSNNEIIIGGFQLISALLQGIGDLFSTLPAQVVLFTTLAAIGVSMLGNQMEQNAMAQEKAELENKARIIQQEKEISARKEALAERDNLLIQKENAVTELKKLKTKNKALVTSLKEKALNEDLDADEQKALADAEAFLATADEQIKLAEEEYEAQKKSNAEYAIKYANEIELAEQQLQYEERSLDLLKQQSGAFSGLMSFARGFVNLLSIAEGIQAFILVLTGKQTAAEVRKNAEQKKGFAQMMLNAAAKAAESVAANPGWGWAIALAILAAVGVAAFAGISAINQMNSAAGKSENINKLSNEIYKLNEQANALDNLANSFDKLDNKIIKTKKDLDEMNSLLKQASESMDTEASDEFGGKSEQEYYNALSDRGKREYLDTKQRLLEQELQSKRQEQIDTIKSLSKEELSKFLDDDTTDATILQAQDAIYALNNNYLYGYIDSLKELPGFSDEAAKSVETITQAMLENMSAAEAWELTQDPQKIKSLAEALSAIKTSAIGADGKEVSLSAAEVLDSESYSLKDRVEAYEELLQTLKALGPEYQSVVDSFMENYSGYDVFAQMNTSTLEFLETTGITIDKINELYGAWDKLQKSGVEISQAEWEGKFDSYLNALAETQGDVLAATEMIFGEYLDDSEDALNAFIKAYGDLVSIGILNMGQNMDKTKNSITTFYEKALEWNTMSESDRSNFLLDNAELFKGEDGAKLLEAFERGNYSDIEEALSSNKTLQEQMNRRRREVEQELLIEEAKTGDERNEAYIAELKRYQEYLNDRKNLFKASLEVRLEQEQAQLDEYRSYLEEQQSALEESLNKRKEAYEKYFEAINQEEEDKDYEEQTNQLITNLSKLGSTSNATAIQQTKELEQQLADLEEERLKELRERAQEAILSNMDDQLEEINEKFDKLLESNQNLLTALKMDLVNPQELISDMIAQQIEGGATALEIEDYIQSLESTFGAVLGNNVDWDGIQVREENNQLLLNVNGTEIALDTQNEQNLYQAIMKALREVGLR